MKEIERYNGYYVDEQGNVYKKLKSGAYRQKKICNGKTKVTKDGEVYTVQVSRVVYETFKGVQLSRYDYILHKDKDLNNNSISNLCLVRKNRSLHCYKPEQELIKAKGYNDLFFDENGILYLKDGDIYYVMQPNHKGMVRVSQGGKQYHISVARLIYTTLHGEVPKDKIILHIDGNVLNNRLDNLRCKDSIKGIKIWVKFNNKRIIPFPSIKSFYNFMVTHYRYQNGITKFRKQLNENSFICCKVLGKGKKYV